MRKISVCLIVSSVALFLLPFALMAQADEPHDCCFLDGNVAGSDSGIFSLQQQPTVMTVNTVSLVKQANSQTILAQPGGLNGQGQIAFSSPFIIERRGMLSPRKN